MERIPPSAVQRVCDTLAFRPDIIVVGVQECNYLPERDGYWSQTFDFFVAPVGHGLFTGKELQALMMSLVPDGMEVSCKDDFNEFDEDIEFGKLYFDEAIGTEKTRRVLTLSAVDIGDTRGFVHGQQVIETEKEIRHRTLVRLFPTTDIAKRAMGGENEFRVDKAKLLKTRSLDDRIKGLFK